MKKLLTGNFYFREQSGRAKDSHFKKYFNWFEQPVGEINSVEDSFFISVETESRSTHPNSIDLIAGQVKIKAAKTLLSFFNRDINEQYEEYFKNVAFYKEGYPGARLKLLFELKKEDLFRFPERDIDYRSLRKTAVKLAALLKFKARYDSERRA